MVRHRKNICIAIAIIFFLAMGCCTVNSGVGKMIISDQKALEIANNEAVKLGYNIKDMKVHIDDGNTIWTQYTSNGQLLKSNPHIEEKLKNRNLWAVYYEPKEIQFGGDIFIFIDKNTGEIIFTLPGK